MAVHNEGPYLRLRVRSTAGILSVLSAQQAEGPFVEPEPAEGAIVQEIQIGGRTVIVGDVGDRAFPARSVSHRQRVRSQRPETPGQQKPGQSRGATARPVLALVTTDLAN